jgi:hypothetical protein
VAPWIDLYVKQFTFEFSAKDQFYLFHPAADNTRCVVSSAWTQMVKTAFSKYSPNKTATPPKLLRSSFITVRPPPRTPSQTRLAHFVPSLRQYIRSSDAAPDVLQSAATTMRHLIDTQSSGEQLALPPTHSPPRC